MKLPAGNLERFVNEKDISRGLHELCIAYRDGELRIYATDGAHMARVLIDASKEELDGMAELLGSIDYTKVGFMLSKSVYKALRKAKEPFCLAKVDKAWFLKTYSGAMHHVRLEANPRLVWLLEELIRGEFDRVNLGLLMFDPELAKDCIVAVNEAVEVGMPPLEFPADEKRPIIVRKNGNIAAMMSISGGESILTKIEELCTENSSNELAWKIMKLLGKPYSIPAAEGTADKAT